MGQSAHLIGLTDLKKVKKELARVKLHLKTIQKKLAEKNYALNISNEGV